MDVVFRTEPLDGPAASRLLSAFAEEIALRYPGWDASIGPSARPEEFVHPVGSFLVGHTGERAVACGGIKRLGEATGEVKRLYVVPEARGRRVARRLLRSLEDAALDLKWRTVRLDTGNQQPDAVALFRSAGYVEIDDYNGNPYATHWFERSLV